MRITLPRTHLQSGLIIALTCLAHQTANAAPILLEGTIGTAPVIMEFDVDKDHSATGRYFYRKYHTDVALDGKQNASGMIEMGENRSYDNESQIDMRIHADHGNWTGEWFGHDPKHPKHLPIQLKPYSGPIPKRQLADDATTYDQVRLLDMTLQPNGTSSFQGHALSWRQEPTSKIRFFRIDSGYPPATLQRVNKALEDRQWQEVHNYFSCMLGGARMHGADYDQTVTPHLISPQVVSLSIVTGYFCGGAHPDGGDAPLNIDVASGQPLQLEDILWLGKGIPAATLKYNADGQPTTYDYNTNILAPWLVKTLSQLYPTQMKQPKSEDDCNYKDSEVWNFPSWYMTLQGLHVGASFARVARACDDPDWSNLPWRIVNQHAGRLKVNLP